jgi:hypothetical protein
MNRRPLLIAVASATLVAACGGGFPAPAPAGPAAGDRIVVVSAEGKLATSTPLGLTTRVPPTPTFDSGFGSVLTPLAGTPTAAASELQRSPTPELRPTRTPAPTFTPYPTIEVPPVGDFAANDPTGDATGSPGSRPGRPTAAPRGTATPTPVDPFEKGGRTNNDLATATPLKTNTDVRGLLSSPADVDVFRFDVNQDDNQQIVVTLTGQDMDAYRMFLITPGQRSAAYGTPVGTVAKHIVFPIRNELGTWYVELSPQPGKRLPRGGYTLKVTTRSMTEPAPPAA